MIQVTPDISIYIILVGTIFLYFGKVIGDTKVEKYDKLSYYLEGLIFSSIFIFLPFFFAWYLVLNNITLSSFIWIVLIQLFILGCLSWNIRAHGLLRRYGLLEEFKKRLRKELERFKSENSIKGLTARKEEWFKQKFGMDYIELNVLGLYTIPINIFGNKISLFLFSLTTIWITLSLINADILELAISALLSFIILTMIALAYGFGSAYYPFARVHLKNGKTIEGRVLKFGEFVYLLSGKRKVFVNSSEIVFVEESLFKGENL